MRQKFNICGNENNFDLNGKRLEILKEFIDIK